MSRHSLSLLLVSLVTAPAALAEGNRSLGVTVSPVGAFMIPSSTGPGPQLGYSAALGWNLSSTDSVLSFGGHATSSLLFSEASPVVARLTPLPRGPVRPFVAVGPSVLVVHGTQTALGAKSPPVRLGLEASVGVEVPLSRTLFVSSQMRVQSFSYSSDPLAGRRLSVTSAHAGLGFSL